MSEAKNARLELRLRNDLTELDRLSEALEGFCEAKGVPTGAAYHLNLVLDELVTNIVSYGYEADAGEREIVIQLQREPEAVAVVVEDDGRAFDPLSAKEPDLDASVEERPIGGLGLHFLRTLMDDLCYRREDGRNRLGFRKPLTGQPNAA